MQNIIDQLQAAQQKAMSSRPKVNGFPFLAEVLRQSGVKRNVWSLPSCQSIFWMEDGQVVQQMTPLISEPVQIMPFDESVIVAAIKKDQLGESEFVDFLKSLWNAGVIWYQVDFDVRTVTYGGTNGQSYTESYEQVTVT